MVYQARAADTWRSSEYVNKIIGNDIQLGKLLSKEFLVSCRRVLVSCVHFRFSSGTFSPFSKGTNSWLLYSTCIYSTLNLLKYFFIMIFILYWCMENKLQFMSQLSSGEATEKRNLHRWNACPPLIDFIISDVLISFLEPFSKRWD